MLNNIYRKTAIIMNRIYYTVLWATMSSLNFMKSRMAAIKRAIQGLNRIKQNKYFKRKYLIQIILLSKHKRWASLYLSLYVSHHCLFQERFILVTVARMIVPFSKMVKSFSDFLCVLYIFALFLSFFATFQPYFGLFQKRLTLNLMSWNMPGLFIHRHFSSLFL